MCIRDRFRTAPQAAAPEPVPKGLAAAFAASIVYEDAHLLVVNKPAGVLSQKAKPSDSSLVEALVDYLYRKKEVTPESLAPISYTHLDVYKRQDIGSCSRKPFPGRKLFITRFFPMWSVSRWDSRVCIPGRDPGYQWDLWHRYFLRQTFPMKIPGCLSEISAARCV